MTPKQRAESLVKAQGEELSRHQRMFLADDIEKEITEAVEPFLELAKLVAQDYEDAADWKDARGRLLGMAQSALASADISDEAESEDED